MQLLKKKKSGGEGGLRPVGPSLKDRRTLQIKDAIIAIQIIIMILIISSSNISLEE